MTNGQLKDELLSRGAQFHENTNENRYSTGLVKYKEVMHQSGLGGRFIFNKVDGLDRVSYTIYTSQDGTLFIEETLTGEVVVKQPVNSNEEIIEILNKHGFTVPPPTVQEVVYLTDDVMPDRLSELAFGEVDPNSIAERIKRIQGKIKSLNDELAIILKELEDNL